MELEKRALEELKQYASGIAGGALEQGCNFEVSVQDGCVTVTVKGPDGGSAEDRRLVAELKYSNATLLGWSVAERLARNQMKLAEGVQVGDLSPAEAHKQLEELLGELNDVSYYVGVSAAERVRGLVGSWQSHDKKIETILHLLDKAGVSGGLVEQRVESLINREEVMRKELEVRAATDLEIHQLFSEAGIREGGDVKFRAGQLFMRYSGLRNEYDKKTHEVERLKTALSDVGITYETGESGQTILLNYKPVPSANSATASELQRRIEGHFTNSMQQAHALLDELGVEKGQLRDRIQALRSLWSRKLDDTREKLTKAQEREEAAQRLLDGADQPHGELRDRVERLIKWYREVLFAAQPYQGPLPVVTLSMEEWCKLKELERRFNSASRGWYNEGVSGLRSFVYQSKNDALEQRRAWCAAGNPDMKRTVRVRLVEEPEEEKEPATACTCGEDNRKPGEPALSHKSDCPKNGE